MRSFRLAHGYGCYVVTALLGELLHGSFENPVTSVACVVALVGVGAWWLRDAEAKLDVVLDDAHHDGAKVT